jgi:hypothetical protein
MPKIGTICGRRGVANAVLRDHDFHRRQAEERRRKEKEADEDAYMALACGEKKSELLTPRRSW